MAYSSLAAVSSAVLTALNVSAMTAFVPGGVQDGPQERTRYPAAWISLRERETRGFGTRGLPEVELRVHAVGQRWKEVRSIVSKAVELLRDQALTVTGYSHCGLVFYDDIVELEQPEIVDGTPHREAVAMFRIYVEES